MTTRCTVIKITRRDATVEGYTEHDRDLTIDSVDYLSSAGYTPFSVQRTSDISADNQEYHGLIDNDNITASDILSGRYDGARLEFILVDWSTQTKVRTLGIYIIGAVSVISGKYVADMRSIESELQKPIGRIVTLRCQYDLGDSDCGYSLSADSGEVDSVTSARRVFVDAALSQADGYYNGGKVVWTSGENTGRTMDVRRYIASTDTIELFEPMQSDIAVSDQYSIYRGCDKTIATCIGTFSNGVNFGGFPYVPGQSNLISGNT